MRLTGAGVFIVYSGMLVLETSLHHGEHLYVVIACLVGAAAGLALALKGERP